MKRGFTSASPAQRAKAQAASHCRVCARSGDLDPMHVTDRALQGCDDAECVIPACRPCHREYDQGLIDILPVLSKGEQAHAVEHSGVLAMLHQVTGVRWAPEPPRLAA